MGEFKIVDNKKLGELHGKIHLLKVNYNWDSKRENRNLINSKEEYMNWITDIDKTIKELYAPN
jgi:hypothetical protein